MKILMVNTRHFRGGGDSTYTFNVAEVLRSKGHEVAFFAMKDQRNIADANSDLFVEHIDFRELNRKKNIQTGFRVLKHVVYSSEARKKFARLLDRFNPHLVHLQNIHGHISPSVIFEAKKRRIPVVWTLHDYKMVCPNTHFLIDATGEICEACLNGSFYYAPLKRCKKDSLLASLVAAIETYVHRAIGILDMVDLFLAPSFFLGDKIVKGGVPHEKAKHLPYVLLNNMFQFSPGDKKYLLFMGRVEAIKGIYPLLKACQEASAVRLKIAGRVDEQFISQLLKFLPSNAEYVGMKSGEALRNLLLGARAVVVPSLWYENQPFSIIEAFAAGKPVIASDLGGMTELVKDSERGLLVPPGDVRALAEAMKWMIDHADEARKMGGNAREYALREHGAERHYERLMQIYQRIMN